jgi:hypothetical protein
MKTKICLAMFFAVLFAFTSFAGTVEYRIIEVNGTVKVPMRVKVGRLFKTLTLTISPTDVGKPFLADEANPNGSIGLGNCSSHLIFAKAVAGSDAQIANRSCSKQPQCSGPDCRPDNIATIAVRGGNRRDEMDAFLRDGGQLDVSFIAELKNAALSNSAILNGTIQNKLDVNVLQQQQVSPVIQRQNAPINNKAIIKQR